VSNERRDRSRWSSLKLNAGAASVGMVLLGLVVLTTACGSGVTARPGLGGAGGGTSMGGAGGGTSMGGAGGGTPMGGAGGGTPMGGAGGGTPMGGAGGGTPMGGAGGQLVCTSTVVPLPPTGCPAVLAAPLGVSEWPDEGANHEVLCSTVCYGTNPPSSGHHYGTWPIYKTYAQPVPWGFLVHGMEHGAVIVSYNCPCGCADEVAAAQAWIDSLPPDASCASRPRIVLAPDPTLDVRWAAAAWRWTLRAETFDAAAFGAFFSAHYDHASESICGGATDGSAAGWCN